MHGYGINFSLHKIIVKETVCTPSCVRGICIDGQCNCRPGFIGIDCSGILLSVHIDLATLVETLVV